MMEPDAVPSPDVVPGLYWGIRASFVRYVLGNPDGEVYGDDGVETDGEGVFRFPLIDEAREGDEHVLRFGGDLRFIAHGGMLSVRLQRPVVRVGTQRGTLSVQGGDGEVVIAGLTAATPVPIGGGWSVYPPLAAVLDGEGVALFGDAYGAGEPLDDLRIAFRDGAAA